MIVLALDTCLNACSAAVVRDGQTLAARFEPMSRGHQERLALMVQETMAEAGLAFSAIDRIGVTVGPGSFTGLRVGLAFAKGLALALGRPLIGVGSLEALGADTTGLAVAIADARRDQAYWQGFSGGVPMTPPTASAVVDIVDWLTEQGGPASLTGPGVSLISSQLPNLKAIPRVGPSPETIARLAAAASPPLAPPRPIYLRTPDAKLPGGLEPVW
ncbi:tRNA (adenosine(37)-N6)-threonylcarbamoyltransferase complex dimerization subunit type 1 TsaB [soil metagenome]